MTMTYYRYMAAGMGLAVVVPVPTAAADCCWYHFVQLVLV